MVWRNARPSGVPTTAQITRTTPYRAMIIGESSPTGLVADGTFAVASMMATMGKQGAIKARPTRGVSGGIRRTTATPRAPRMVAIGMRGATRILETGETSDT